VLSCGLTSLIGCSMSTLSGNTLIKGLFVGWLQGSIATIIQCILSSRWSHILRFLPYYPLWTTLTTGLMLEAIVGYSHMRFPTFLCNFVPVALTLSFVTQKVISQGSSYSNLFFPKYERTGIDAFVDAEINNKVTIHDLRKKDKYVLIPSYKIGTGPVIFGEYCRSGIYFGDELDLRDLAKATSAAPTFFPGHPIDSYSTIYDGTFVVCGIFYNNPSIVAYLQAYEFDPKRPIILVSVGTGLRGKNSKPVHTNGGAVDWVDTIVKLGLNSEDTHLKLEKLFNSGQFLYYRLNIHLEQDFDLDDVESVSKLKKAVESWIPLHREKFKSLARLLLDPSTFDEHRYMTFPAEIKLKSNK